MSSPPTYVIGAVLAWATISIASAQTKSAQIIDPVYQLQAYSWTIPADWKFDGAVLEGNGCNTTPYPVFRMTAPDGITQLKSLPRFDWTWSTGQGPHLAQKSDCLPFSQQLTAAQFLQLMVKMLGVTFVSEVPQPANAQYQQTLREQSAGRASTGFKVSGDMARFLVRYNAGSAPVDEYLSATIRCTENTRRFGVNQALMSLYSCSATLTRGRTRQGQLEAMQNRFQAIGKSVAVNPQWNQKWQAAMMAKAQADMRRGTETIVARGEAARALQQREHEQFLAVMQRGTDMSMQRTNDAMNARSRAADDWCDYALDLQKRRDPVTGNVTKDSNRYSYTWINEFGERYQTNDPNDNPSGRLKGNWTQQQNVR
jgi:hypothetical protein